MGLMRRNRGYGKRTTVIPEKCKDCTFYTEQDGFAESITKAFGTFPRWDFDVCNFSCWKETKNESERKKWIYYKGKRHRNDFGYRNNGEVENG